jgi:hypothetical protein
MSARDRRASLLRAALLFGLTLPFLVPLLRPGWIQSHEGYSYPIRLVEVIRCWDDGFWSARWFPDLNHGQGYPFLCFYAPAVFFLSGVFHAAGAPLDLALKLTVAIGTIAGTAGAYRLARIGVGPSGAVVAAALYTYAPYHVREVFIRGDLAEYLAMGFLPWSLWSVARLTRRCGARDASLVAATAALPILSHNILGMLTGGTLMMATALTVMRSDRRVATAVAAAAGGAGALLLTAFFWAPALQERAFVHIDVLTSGHFVVQQHFVSARDLLGRGEFPGVGQGLPMTFEIGWVGLLTLLAVPWAWRSSDGGRRLVISLGAVLVGVGVVMATVLGDPVYRAVELLQFVQFPWRFLSVVALGIALLGGVGIGAVGERFGRAVRLGGAATVTAASVLFVAGILGPKVSLPLPPWSVDPAEYRRRPETTTRGEYLPIWVTDTRTRPRFTDGVFVVGEANVLSVDRRVGRWKLTVESARAATVVLEDLYYPGWQASAGGAAVGVAPREGTGNLELSVESGRHEIEVRLTLTPWRRACGGVSLAMVVVGIIAVVSSGVRARRREAGALSPIG